MMASAILIVEDDPDDGLLIRHQLEKNGDGDEKPRIVLCETGRCALQAMAEEHFDTVFVDLNLPDVSGLELIRTVRRSAPHILVMALSGADVGPRGENMKELAADAGAVCFVEKPFSGADNELYYNLARTAKSVERKGYEEGSRRKHWRTTLGGAVAVVGASTIVLAMMLANLMRDNPLMWVAMAGIVVKSAGDFVTAVNASDKDKSK